MRLICFNAPAALARTTPKDYRMCSAAAGAASPHAAGSAAPQQAGHAGHSHCWLRGLCKAAGRQGPAAVACAVAGPGRAGARIVWDGRQKVGRGAAGEKGAVSQTWGVCERRVGKYTGSCAKHAGRGWEDESTGTRGELADRHAGRMSRQARGEK
eukprot:365810-Chlamydomonas_euryale.AAC.39